jgi:hypothetical protein
MLKVTAHPASNLESHQCESIREGDWIVYRCPKCDYELRDNWRTGELKVLNPKIEIKHSGSYFPTEYQEVYDSLN